MLDDPDKDRLQPALLDRLCDNEPDKTTEPPEARVLSKARLRQCVLRDLRWLLNSEGLLPDDPAHDDPLLAGSVVHYGIPSLAGMSAASLDKDRISKALKAAILAFEPRLLRDSVSVVATGSHNSVSLKIEAKLWEKPFPEELLMQTTLDLETGHIRDDGDGGGQ